MSISLGIITAELQNYGGSEIYILECIKRWQKELDIVVYTSEFNRKLFKEFDIDQRRVSVKILPKVKNRKHRFDLLDSLVIRPRIWERHIAHHDLYFQYLFPAQMVRKSPSIWFAAEPLRMLYDLRHHEAGDDSRISFHVYPRMRYDSATKSDLNVLLQIVQELDANSNIENLVTNSHMMEGYLEAVYGRKADLVAYPGINPPASYDGPTDNSTALFVGRLWDHKRVDLAIKALAKLKDGQLIIVGEGPEKKGLKRLSRALGLGRRVRFVGKLSNAQLDRVYRSVTCGIYTPVREPFGIMPLEAASYGMPVVVTPDAGYTEVLDHTSAHIVPAEPERIAAALESLFSDHQTAREMGQAARLKVENFTWDHTAGVLLKLFKQTLTKQRRVITASRNRPLLGAHYYPWYRSGETPHHWNENSDYSSVNDLPLIGTYSSSDDAVISRHLQWVTEAGLDFLVVNLQISADGLSDYEIRATEKLFELAESSAPQLSLAVMLTCANADSESIEESLQIIRQHFFGRINYLAMEAKPVLWYFISESFIGHFYHRYSKLLETNRDYHCVAASGFSYSKNLPVHYGDFFNGWSLYSPLQISAAEHWQPLWNSGYQDFIESKRGECLGVFSLCPGFDDRALTLAQRKESEYRRIPRRDGETYRLMQQTCLDLEIQPDLVVITSFNEFHENTQIEPSRKYGEQYLRMTREFSERLAQGGKGDPRDAASRLNRAAS